MTSDYKITMRKAQYPRIKSYFSAALLCVCLLVSSVLVRLAFQFCCDIKYNIQHVKNGRSELFVGVIQLLCFLHLS